jgi:hypothetical protein
MRSCFDPVKGYRFVGEPPHCKSDVVFALGIVGVNRVPLGACYVFPREGDVVTNITVSGLANDSTDISATLFGESLADVMTVSTDGAPAPAAVPVSSLKRRTLLQTNFATLVVNGYDVAGSTDQVKNGDKVQVKLCASSSYDKLTTIRLQFGDGEMVETSLRTIVAPSPPPPPSPSPPASPDVTALGFALGSHVTGAPTEQCYMFPSSENVIVSGLGTGQSVVVSATRDDSEYLSEPDIYINDVKKTSDGTASITLYVTNGDRLRIEVCASASPLAKSS